MQLLVLGASGKTGTALVAQGLERGHGVTAFGRSAYGGRSHDALRIVPGSCLSADDLAAALPGHDAVVSALGTRGIGATTLLRDSAVAAADALTRAGVIRLIVISSTLVDGASWLARVAARTLLRHHTRDQRAMEKVVGQSDLDWTIVRAPRLSNGTPIDRFMLRNDPPSDLPASISRSDLARLMLEAVEHGSHLKQIVSVARTQS